MRAPPAGRVRVVTGAHAFGGRGVTATPRGTRRARGDAPKPRLHTRMHTLQATPEARGGAQLRGRCCGALHRRLGCAVHLKLKPAGGARELLGTTRSTAVANTMCARVPSRAPRKGQNTPSALPPASVRARAPTDATAACCVPRAAAPRARAAARPARQFRFWTSGAPPCITARQGQRTAALWRHDARRRRAALLPHDAA
jgi:hypothetical protein